MRRSLRAWPFTNLFWRLVGGWRKNECIERFQSAWSVFLYPEWLDFESVCLCIQQCLEMWFQCLRFDGRVVWVCFCDELVYIRFAEIPQRKNVLNVSFPNHWPCDAFANLIYFGRWDVGKSILIVAISIWIQLSDKLAYLEKSILVVDLPIKPWPNYRLSWIQPSNFARSNIVRPFGHPCWMIFVKHFLFDQVLDGVCFWSNIATNNSARHKNVAVFCRSSKKVVSWI